MRKLSILLVFLCLVTIISCTPKIDTQLEKQVQTEAYEFETLLSKLATHVSSIKNPADIDLRSIIPDTWLFEETSKGYALGIPISKEVGRGYAVIKSDVLSGWTTFNRAGKLNPETEIYIGDSWNGQPYNWGGMEFKNQELRNYPQRATLDCFKSNKVMKQPFMVPPEATHGVYLEERKKMGGSTSALSKIVQQMREANPYLEKSQIEQLKTSNLSPLIEQLPPEIAKINDDIVIALSFVKNLDSKYFTPNSGSYDRQNQLVGYRDSMEKIKIQLSQIGEYVQMIKKWDFSNLEKYLALKNK